MSSQAARKRHRSTGGAGTPFAAHLLVFWRENGGASIDEAPLWTTSRAL
jgi:hypothetical protein